MGRRRPGDLVAGQRIAVDGIDPAVAAHHLCQGNRDVAAAGADVDAAPARTQPETLQRRRQRPPVDVVAQSLEFTHGQSSR